ncbi:MAG: hypothetical protein JXA67_02325 [Micromonosporaceae bacterium]|nr:hypothetical protein [Micromonosporaceae bacterium]
MPSLLPCDRHISVPKKLPIIAVLTTLVVGLPLGLATAALAETGTSTVIAGTGTAGSSGDGGAANAALLNHPAGVATASDGTLYLSDQGNHIVRRVTPSGTITTIAGTGKQAASSKATIPSGAQGTATDLGMPQQLALGPDQTLYIADSFLFRVLALSPNGTLSVVAGTGVEGFSGDGGPAIEATLRQLGGLAVGADGTVYLGDLGNQRVRAVSPAGTISTVAGTGAPQLTAASGTATQIAVPSPNSLAVDPDGALWIADGLVLHRVSAGQLVTITRPADRNGLPAGSWEVSDTASWPPSDTPLNNIAAVAAGKDGVYAFDQQEHAILRIGPDHALATVATTKQAVIGQLAVTASGDILLAETNQHQILLIRPKTPTPTDDDGELPLRPWILGATGIGVGLVVCLVLLWRRRLGR